MTDIQVELQVMFKTDVLGQVSDTEISLLAGWISEILSDIELKDFNQPSGLMN